MLGFGRKLTAAAVAMSLCAVPTVAIGATPAAPAAVPQASVQGNPWLTLSAMTTSSSATTAAVAGQGNDGPGFPPIAPLAVILATIAAAIYIAVNNGNGHVSVSPQ